MWWTVSATMLIVPIIVSAGGQDAFRTPKRLFFIAAVMVLAGLAAATCIVAFPHVRRAIVARPRLALIATAAVVWSAVCAGAATNRDLSWRSVGYATSVAFFILVTWWLAQIKGIAAAYVVAAPAAINAVVFLAQRFHMWDPMQVDPNIPTHFRYTALLGNPNDVGSFFVAPLMALIGLALVDKPRRKLWWPLVLLVATAVSTGSITAIAASAAGVFTLVGIYSGRRAVRGATIVVIIFAAVVFGFRPLRDRLMLIRTQIEAGDYATAFSGRVTPFLAARDMARQHPLTGVGPGCFKYEYFPYKVRVESRNPNLLNAYAHRFNFSEVHNDHLQVLAECGVIGYLIMLAAFALLARGSIQKERVTTPHGEFARLLSLPLAVALFVLCVAQFPLQLTASTVAFGFIGALCVAWSENKGVTSQVDGTERAAPYRSVRMWDYVAFTAIAAVVFVSIRDGVVRPYRCNLWEKRIQAVTIAALDERNRNRVRIALQNLEQLRPCLESCPTDIDQYMLVAANLRILDRLDEALATYAAGLAFDRRPELYYNIGMIHLDQGNRAAGIQNLYQAAMFDRAILNEVPYDAVREEVAARVNASTRPQGSSRAVPDPSAPSAARDNRDPCEACRA